MDRALRRSRTGISELEGKSAPVFKGPHATELAKMYKQVATFFLV
jgi:hypothetical protein